MSKTWPIEAEDTISLCQKITQFADQEILDHRTVSMEQHDPRRGHIATLDIVQSYTIAFYEFAKRRVSSFGDPREYDVAKDQEKDHCVKTIRLVSAGVIFDLDSPHSRV